MNSHKKIEEKKKVEKLRAAVNKYGKDTGINDLKPTVVWLKKMGLPALAELLSDA